MCVMCEGGKGWDKGREQHKEGALSVCEGGPEGMVSKKNRGKTYCDFFSVGELGRAIPGVSSRPTAEKVGEDSQISRETRKNPVGAAGASAAAWEQSQRSTGLPGLRVHDHY